mmetsp:Transcript_16539/g.27123  ORF Transcript_16539/g.27123 Transcript_16539/m.27123 type:complete len:188 (-) Transcript_16539:4-567(-)
MIVVRMLDSMVSTLDKLMDKYHAEKIKTIGDAYMAVVGLDGLDKEKLKALMELALDIQELSRSFVTPDDNHLSLRIGIAIGGAAAGIIGNRKWSYDLWGEAVDLAQEMESTGSPDMIHVTKEVHDRLADTQFVFVERCNDGEVVATLLTDKENEDDLDEEKDQDHQESPTTKTKDESSDNKKVSRYT